MKTSFSLPLIKSQRDLFYPQKEIKQTKAQFYQRFASNGQLINNSSSSTNNKNLRNLPLIQLDELFSNNNKEHGFHSFASINSVKGKQIVQQALKVKLKTSSLRHSLKAEIVFNKNQYKKIEQHCKQLQLKQKQLLKKTLKQLEPSKNKDKIKSTRKYKDKIKKTVGLQLRFKRHMYQINKTCWKPYVDYESIAVAASQLVFFFGGRKQCQVGSYNAKQNKWNLQKNLDLSKIKPFGLTTGTMISKNQVLFFGGVQYSMQTMSIPMNLVQRANFQTGKVKVFQYDPLIVPQRYYHAQCLYGQYIIISGGISSKEKQFSDFMTYNIQKNYWVDLPIAKRPQSLKLGFAKHKMVSVFYQREFYSIFDNTQVVIKQGDDKIMQQGVYMFGGEDHNGQLTNKVYIVKIGAPSIVIIEPKIEGRFPKQRKNFAMTKYKSYIIIHGGRNDEMNPFILQSVHCLNLINLNWINVVCQKQFRRYNHTISEFVNDQIVILGGIGNQGLCKDVYAYQIEQIVEYV